MAENELQHGSGAKGSLRSAGSPHSQEVPATSPLSPHAKEKKKKKTPKKRPKNLAIHTLGTGMTSTWSHYITRERDKHKIQSKGKRLRGWTTIRKITILLGCVKTRLQHTLGGDPFSSTGGGRELVLVLAAGGSTL